MLFQRQMNDSDNLRQFNQQYCQPRFLNCIINADLNIAGDRFVCFVIVGSTSKVAEGKGVEFQQSNFLVYTAFLITFLLSVLLVTFF